MLAHAVPELDPPPGVDDAAADVALMDPTPLAARPDPVMTLQSDYLWSKIVSFRWRHVNEHINALELRAAILAVRWALSRPLTVNTRTMLIVDSAVVYYTMRKGRSSSPRLLAVYRRFAALLLASGLLIVPVWVPSAANPADGASRLTA